MDIEERTVFCLLHQDGLIVHVIIIIIIIIYTNGSVRGAL